MILGQIKVEEKSNEITAIPQVLRALELSECIVTIDAISLSTFSKGRPPRREASRANKKTHHGTAPTFFPLLDFNAFALIPSHVRVVADSRWG